MKYDLSTQEAQLYAIENEYRYLYQQVYYHLRHSINKDVLVSDLAQDAYLKAYDSTLRGAGPKSKDGGVKGWLSRVAMSTVYDFYRREKKRGNYNDQPDDFSQFSGIAEEELFTPDLEAQMELAKSLIPSAPNSVQPVLNLAFEGYSNPEIAETLDISLERVKTYKNRGKNYLRAQISGFEDYEF